MNNKLYKKDYIQEINEEKENIVNDVFLGKQPTKELLMMLMFKANELYQEKDLSRKSFLVLIEAIKELWNETFDSEMFGAFFGSSDMSSDFDTWDD